MALSDDLEKEVARVFRETWTVREGQVVPEPEGLALAKNEAVHFERATILYADLSGSTALVDQSDWSFAAEVYQTYLFCAGRIIRSDGGTIVAYDGDRVMAVLIGGSQCTNAAKCALRINYAVKRIINPAIENQYGRSTYAIKQVVGIDTSEIRAVRTGVRGGNDLVWVGRAANYAAKLTTLTDEYATWITDDVFRYTGDSSKYAGEPKTLMWEARIWKANGDMRIHRSNWHWPL